MITYARIMPKEITFAILIGFILGLLITFGVYTANKAIQEQGKQTKAEGELSPTPAPSAASQNTLTLSEPVDEELFTDSGIVVSGRTNPKALVVIVPETGEFLLEADDDGFFSQKITLENGVNSVTIVSTDAFGSQAQATLILTYTTKLATPAPEETDEP